MNLRLITIDPPTPARGRIVLLPAARQRLEDFMAAGFDSALRQRALPMQLEFAAPVQSHLTDPSWIGALREHLRPGGASPVRPLWLGGISLGAFMALRYAAVHAAEIDGLCLIAPYLGSRIVAARIARQEKDFSGPEDDERHVWRLVQSLPRDGLAVFAGLGREDRFADTQRLLKQMLPPDCICEVPGGHEWPVWRTLWDSYLDRLASGA